jgi:hypothetical protein
VSDVRVVMTIRADGDAELLEAQRAFLRLGRVR